MSSWTTTVPNSVRNSDPVGHTSRHAAWVQCLQTSLDINQRRPLSPMPSFGAVDNGGSRSGLRCSMKATCRHVDAPRRMVLSKDIPVNKSPSSGTRFHSLHATSHALQPMHTVV